jgi:hypothetical protein
MALFAGTSRSDVWTIRVKQKTAAVRSYKARAMVEQVDSVVRRQEIRTRRRKIVASMATRVVGL